MVVRAAVMGLPVLILVALAGCASKPPSAPVDIVAKDFEFQPTSKTAAHGVPVSWHVRNDDSVRHSLTQTFNLNLDEDLPPGETTTVTFTAPAATGTYKIPCKYHSDRGMELDFEVT